jgi:hypothetical protein
MAPHQNAQPVEVEHDEDDDGFTLTEANHASWSIVFNRPWAMVTEVLVYVRQQEVLDLLRAQALRGERGQDAGNRVTDPGIHDRDAARLDDEMDRIQPRAVVAGIDGADAVGVIDDIREHGRRLL